jgi:hypothetical protein
MAVKSYRRLTKASNASQSSRPKPRTDEQRAYERKVTTMRTKLVIMSMAMTAPRSLLSCKKANVRSAGISFDGSAIAALIASVFVGDAIVQPPR